MAELVAIQPFRGMRACYWMSVSNRSNQPRIGVKDQPHLPCARPVLHLGIALDSVDNPLVALHINEPLQVVAHMPGSSTICARVDAHPRFAFRCDNGVGVPIDSFAAQWLAYTHPCRRFAPSLAADDARLGADAVRYSFIAVDLHHLLLAGLPAHCHRNPSVTGIPHLGNPTSWGSRAAEAIPFPGANSTFSSRCGAISGRAPSRPAQTHRKGRWSRLGPRAARSTLSIPFQGLPILVFFPSNRFRVLPAALPNPSFSFHFLPRIEPFQALAGEFGPKSNCQACRDRVIQWSFASAFPFRPLRTNRCSCLVGTLLQLALFGMCKTARRREMVLEDAAKTGRVPFVSFHFLFRIEPFQRLAVKLRRPPVPSLLLPLFSPPSSETPGV